MFFYVKSSYVCSCIPIAGRKQKDSDMIFIVVANHGSSTGLADQNHETYEVSCK